MHSFTRFKDRKDHRIWCTLCASTYRDQLFFLPNLKTIVCQPVTKKAKTPNTQNRVVQCHTRSVKIHCSMGRVRLPTSVGFCIVSEVYRSMPSYIFLSKVRSLLILPTTPIYSALVAGDAIKVSTIPSV